MEGALNSDSNDLGWVFEGCRGIFGCKRAVFTPENVGFGSKFVASTESKSVQRLLVRKIYAPLSVSVMVPDKQRS